MKTDMKNSAKLITVFGIAWGWAGASVAVAGPSVCLFDSQFGEQSGRPLVQASCVKQEKSAYIFLAQTQSFLRVYTQEKCESPGCFTDYAMENAEQCDAALFFLGREKVPPFLNERTGLKTVVFSEPKSGEPIPYIRSQRNFWGGHSLKLGWVMEGCDVPPEEQKTKEGELTLSGAQARLKLAKEKRYSTPPSVVAAPSRLPAFSDSRRPDRATQPSKKNAAQDALDYITPAFEDRWGDGSKGDNLK